MRIRLRWIGLIAAAAGACLLCAGMSAHCEPGMSCASAGVPTRAIAIGAGAALSSVAVVWLARAAWLLTAASRAVVRLERADPDDRLRAAMRRTEVRGVECIASPRAMALSWGGLRPRIAVSRGLVTRLSAEELDAVLVHEQHHARRRDPLRRALLTATADVFFFLPVIAWWADRRCDLAEVAADRRAVDRLGPRPVAGALCRLDASPVPISAVGFGGAAELRVAHLLGEDLPLPGPSGRAWRRSAAGLLAAACATACCLGALLTLR